MPVINSSVRIECSPEAVFESVSDPRSELDWNPKVRVMEKITEGPVGVGTRFKAKWTKSPLVELEITSFDRPRGWSYRNGGAISVILTISLEPLDGGRATMLRSTFDATPHGPIKLIFPLLLASLRREEAQNMQLVKKRLESTA